MLILNPERFALLRSVVVDFFILVVLLALISAVLLQGFHEVFRARYNKYVLQEWLKHRRLTLEVSQFCAAMGGSGTAALSLPYWQLTGQIAAALSSELNLFPSSKLVEVLANIDDRYQNDLSTQLENRKVPADNRPAAILRDVAARAQAGINSLHVELRIKWDIFDYLLSFVILVILGALLTGLQQTEGQRAFLYAVILFAWLATPIMRRMLERFVPFR
jgi:hypothetical protein